MARIPVAGPWITDLEIDYVTRAAREAWYEHAGDFNRRFESAFATHVGLPHAIALPSCTSALHLALMALGVGPGDEVIVPDCTWIATAAPVSYVGATPVFADIDERTWCLSADSFEACITERTRAVIPVDLYGSMPDWGAIAGIARRHNVAIIEDAAEAIGSRWHDRPAGSFGDIGVFSFHGSKTLTTGEGGMLVTGRDDLAARVQVLRDHGRQPGDRLFFNSEVAHKYKMSALQAALGLAQLERLEDLVARKREVFGWYREELGDETGVTLNAEPESTLNSYWMVTVILGEGLGDKLDLMRHLDERNIDSRPFFHPLSALPAYQGTPPAQHAHTPIAHSLGQRGLNLPSALSLTRSQVAFVASSVRDYLRTARTR